MVQLQALEGIEKNLRAHRCCKTTPVGFEPTQLALVELESTPLDHSGKVSLPIPEWGSPMGFESSHLASLGAMRVTESITQRSIKSLVSEHKRVIDMAMWVHSSVVRAADCRSAGPWFKSGCALLPASNCGTWSIHRHPRA
jgi:hypothetical protein